jgi:hypothetical protein
MILFINKELLCEDKKKNEFLFLLLYAKDEDKKFLFLLEVGFL